MGRFLTRAELGSPANVRWLGGGEYCPPTSGYFYMLTASHFGMQSPSAGMQPRRIFDHCVPKKKKTKIGCLVIPAFFLHHVSPIAVSCPFPCPVFRFVLPSDQARSRSCLLSCHSVRCVLYLPNALSFALSSLPCPDIPFRALPLIQLSPTQHCPTLP